MESKGFKFSYIIKLFLSYRKGLFLIIVLNLLWATFELIAPFLTKALVDQGIQGRDLNIVYLVLTAQLFLFVGALISDFYRRWILRHIGIRVNLKVINLYLLKLIQKNYVFFTGLKHGKLVQYLNDSVRIEKFLADHVANSFVHFLQIAVYGIILFVFNVNIGFIFLGFILLTIVWTIFFLRPKEIIDHELFYVSANIRGELFEMYSGIVDLKAFNQESNRLSNWNRIQLMISNLRLNFLRLSQYYQGGALSLSQFKDILIIFIGSLEVLEGNMTLGTLLAIQYILGRIQIPMDKLVEFIPKVQEALLSSNRLGEVINEEEVEYNISSSKSFSLNLKGDLIISGLNFSYVEDLVLKNINIRVKYGQSIGIIGESGSGKSTLLKLVLKLLKMKSGEILINGQNINLIPNNELRAHCGAVLQDSHVFRESLLYNITFQKDLDDVDLNRVFDSLRICAIENVISKLADGLLTVIGNEGTNLSKGQLQRILLARAIYTRPDFLILDEPFNALDKFTFLNILSNILKEFKEITVIIVTHRLDVVKQLDYIYYFEDGEILEEGNHDELVRYKSRYAKLIAGE